MGCRTLHNLSSVMLALVAGICALRNTRILTGPAADPWDKPKDDDGGGDSLGREKEERCLSAHNFKNQFRKRFFFAAKTVNHRLDHTFRGQ